MAAISARDGENLPERVTRLETAADTERPHLATKANLERHTRLLVMWVVGTAFAMFSFLIMYMNDRLAAMDTRLAAMDMRLDEILAAILQSGG